MLHFKHQLLSNFLNTAEENFFSMKRLCLNPNKIVIVTLTGFTEVLFIRKGTFYFIFRRLIQIWLSTYEMDNTISFQPQKKLPKAESSCFSFLFFFNASNLFKTSFGGTMKMLLTSEMNKLFTQVTKIHHKIS